MLEAEGSAIPTHPNSDTTPPSLGEPVGGVTAHSVQRVGFAHPSPKLIGEGHQHEVMGLVEGLSK